ncbi:hypothetical protein RJT34_31571 [Clitoria ternatea]|uniref:Uncharacterized protein n=1 Tax=Clitoria ternatea TaxID=43366 RepID=A0AAN9EWN9_CLITE
MKKKKKRVSLFSKLVSSLSREQIGNANKEKVIPTVDEDGYYGGGVGGYDHRSEGKRGGDTLWIDVYVASTQSVRSG